MRRKIALILTAALLGLAVCLPAAAAGAQLPVDVGREARVPAGHRLVDPLLHGGQEGLV